MDLEGGVYVSSAVSVASLDIDLEFRAELRTPGSAATLNTGSIEDLRGHTVDNGTRHVDMVTWTERVLYKQYPLFMNSPLFSSIVAILQVVSMPPVLFIPATDTICAFILAFGFFRQRSRAGNRRIFLTRVG